MERKSTEIDLIVKREQEKLFRYACYKIGNMEDAADILQDVFVKVYSKTFLFSGANNVQGYLYRTVANACHSYHRCQLKKSFISLDIIKDVPDESVRDNSFEKEFVNMERLLSSIPEEQAEIIRLRVLCDKSFIDIAKILELPVTTVKSRFKYGIDKIRKNYLNQNKELF